MASAAVKLAVAVMLEPSANGSCTSDTTGYVSRPGLGANHVKVVCAVSFTTRLLPSSHRGIKAPARTQTGYPLKGTTRSFFDPPGWDMRSSLGCHLHRGHVHGLLLLRRGE
jgi:hypothetical protein